MQRYSTNYDYYAIIKSVIPNKRFGGSLNDEKKINVVLLFDFRLDAVAFRGRV